MISMSIIYRRSQYYYIDYILIPVKHTSVLQQFQLLCNIVFVCIAATATNYQLPKSIIIIIDIK